MEKKKITIYMVAFIFAIIGCVSSLSLMILSIALTEEAIIEFALQFDLDTAQQIYDQLMNVKGNTAYYVLGLGFGIWMSWVYLLAYQRKMSKKGIIIAVSIIGLILTSLVAGILGLVGLKQINEGNIEGQNSSSLEEKLKTNDKLLEQGIITHEEYEERRKKIMEKDDE